MFRRRLHHAAAGLFAAAAFAACAEDAAGPETDALPETPPLADDLVAPTDGGKYDTGYLSNLATELEGVFTAELLVDVSALPAEEQEFERELHAEGGHETRRLIDAQIAFAKNQINAARLHLNLSASEFEVTEAVLDEAGIIHVRYQSTVETIITSVELERSGESLEDIITGRVPAVVPAEPGRMHADVGTACIQAGQEASVHDYNYFYYYDPNRQGCAEAMAAAGIGRVEAALEVRSLAPSDTVYPEYDQLVADGRIDVVSFFGAAEHDWEVGQWDWGTSQRDVFVSDLRARGFREQPRTAPAAGQAPEPQVFTRTVGELLETVTVVGPETLKLLRDDTDGLFGRLVRANEIVFYNGHSFYGSLDVLDDPSIYPGRYQIFFMNSCWSYEYYTKQIFRHNQTASDPDGWLRADVVNDTESGWFHNMGAESRILLSNLLAGAESGGVDGDRYYTWDRIIGAMNDHAVRMQGSRNTETHEVYGVSGVRTNRYDPEAQDTGDDRRYDSAPNAAIPDDAPDGVTDVIEVGEGLGAVDTVTVTVAITHTYVGDLTVSLSHGGRTMTLHDRSGGNRDDLSLLLTVDHFAGLDAAGAWTLQVVDSAAVDEGTLVDWSLTL